MFEVRLPKKVAQNFRVICDGRTKFFESMDAVIEWIFSEECPDSENFNVERMK